MLKDLRYAARQLRAQPGFTLVVVLTIALGIGANTAIFSILNGYLRPLPVHDPEQIVELAADTKGDVSGFAFQFSYPQIRDLRAQGGGFADLFAYTLGIGGFANGGKSAPVYYSNVSGNFFSALGLRPAAGRLYAGGEGEKAGAESIAVLGYAFWQRQLGGDPGVVGRRIRLDGVETRVIGVAPEGFHGLGGVENDLYLPLGRVAANSVKSPLEDRTARWFHLLSRLHPGVTLARAQNSFRVIASRLEQQYPDTDRGIGIRVVPETLARPAPLRFIADYFPFVHRLLLTLSGLVLLLACMNVANLLLVRATVRERELAIRAALGSGRARLIRQTLAEVLLLAGLGAGAGLALGKMGSDAFAASLDLATDIPIVLDFSFDWRVFLYALLAAAVTALLLGLWPALRASHVEPGAALHEGGRSGTGAGHMRLRNLLVAGQVAASLILLISAGMFVRTLRALERLDLGFVPDHVLNARMNPPWAGYSEQRTKDFYRELKRRAKAIPGAESVSFAGSVPMGYYSTGTTVRIEGRPVPPGEQPPLIGFIRADEDYFATMQIPILRGRAFRESDRDAAARVAIVNQTMADLFWPHQDPLGKRFYAGSNGDLPWQIVGVARNGKYLAVFETPLPEFYLPLAQSYTSMRVLQIRSAYPPETVKTAVQQAIQALDPEMPVSDLQTMNEALQGAHGFLVFRFGSIQAGAMGILGLLLAAVGIYGIVSYGAAQRTREIGIRMALGAQPRDVLRLILGQGAVLVAAGIAAGLIGSAAMNHVMARFAVVRNEGDPLVYVTVAALVAATALCACYIPGRRATRIDPSGALRHE